MSQQKKDVSDEINAIHEQIASLQDQLAQQASLQVAQTTQSSHSKWQESSVKKLEPKKAAGWTEVRMTRIEPKDQ